MINETLSKVNRPDFPLNWESTVHLPKIAWKTGTSYGRRDGWSIGYNKRYTVGIWSVIFPDWEYRRSVGRMLPPPCFLPFLIRSIMTTINPGSPSQKIVISGWSARDGLPPAEHCKDLVTDYFIPLISPPGLVIISRSFLYHRMKKLHIAGAVCRKVVIRKNFIPSFPRNERIL